MTFDGSVKSHSDLGKIMPQFQLCSMSVKACLNFLALRIAFQPVQHALGAEMAGGMTPFYSQFGNGFQYENSFGNTGMGQNQPSR
jgi:hypothetical protein